MPITPSLLGSAQAELSMASTPAPEQPLRSRIPRIDELTQNEIYAKRGKTLMQRLASVGLGRTEPDDARNSIDEDSLEIPTYLARRFTT